MGFHMSREELIAQGKKVIAFRRETADEIGLSENYLNGFEEGVAEMIGFLLCEAACDILEEISPDHE